jgi:hypothetical protein
MFSWQKQVSLNFVSLILVPIRDFGFETRGALKLFHGFLVLLRKKVSEVEDDDVSARHWLPQVLNMDARSIFRPRF